MHGLTRKFRELPTQHRELRRDHARRIGEIVERCVGVQTVFAYRELTHARRFDARAMPRRSAQRIERPIDSARRTRKMRKDQDEVHALVVQPFELFAKAFDERASALHEIRHITAKVLREMLEKPEAQPQIKQGIERAQHRCRIGRSAAESTTDGRAFLQPHLHRKLSLQPRFECPMRTDREVIRHAPVDVRPLQRVRMPFDGVARGRTRDEAFDGEVVAKARGNHPRGDGVHPRSVGSTDRERKIHFRRRKGTDHGGHDAQRIANELHAGRLESDFRYAPMAMAAPRNYAPSGLDATNFAALEQLILDRSDLDSVVSECTANLYIATTRNTEDKVAEAAYLGFVREVDPHLKPIASALDRKITSSPFANALPKARYEVLLRALRVDIELFREANIPLETELAELDQKYNQTIGRMSVDFDGATRTMPQMARFLEEGDRGVRERAWTATSTRRLQDRDTIDEIYDRMIALRHQMAINAGFPNFRDFQHRRFKRFDYTPQDCMTMHAAIEEHLVPIQRRLDSERGKQLGASPLRPWDLAVDVFGRQPLRPFDTAEQLVNGCSRMFHEMGGGLGEMFDTLRHGDCLDLESRPGKAPGGYQYQRQYTRTPFIFMNAAGMHRDLVTMVHEAGHAFHSILSKDDPLVDYRNAPTEFAEVASMSMELLTLPYHHEFYSADDCKRALRERLERFPTIMTWIATIDAFQHWVYTNPGHTRAARTNAWRDICSRFGNDISWAGCEDARDTAWQRQLHLFGMPFYYIEYGIAETGAIQMWMQSRRDRPRALENYRKGLTLGGSRPLPELFASAGLRLELTHDLMSELAREVDRELVGC